MVPALGSTSWPHPPLVTDLCPQHPSLLSSWARCPAGAGVPLAPHQTFQAPVSAVIGGKASLLCSRGQPASPGILVVLTQVGKEWQPVPEPSKGS